MRVRQSPGSCPICGAAHTACTAAGRGPILVPQLPARDGLYAEAQLRELPIEISAPVELDPGPGPFSTAEYSRAIHGRPPPGKKRS